PLRARRDLPSSPTRRSSDLDGATPLDLDTAAALSRSASDLLDGLNFDGQYMLEVSSPGVQRPLTTPKHFRRAHGRKVEVTLSDGDRKSTRLNSSHVKISYAV